MEMRKNKIVPNPMHWIISSFKSQNRTIHFKIIGIPIADSK